MSHNNWEDQPRVNGRFMRPLRKGLISNKLISLYYKKIKKDSGNYVYFFKCEEYIKIGKSKNPFERLKAMKVGNPFQIEILFYFRSDKIREEHLQIFYYNYGKHHQNEWFFYDDFTMKIISLLKLYLKSIEQILFFEKGGYSSDLNKYLLNLRKYKKNIRYKKNLENFILKSYSKKMG